MSAEPAAPLISGPPRCRNCDVEMVAGQVKAESVRPLTPANVVWYEANDYSVDLTSAGFFAWSKSPGVPGYMCPKCEMIELHPVLDDLTEPGDDDENEPSGSPPNPE